MEEQKKTYTQGYRGNYGQRRTFRRREEHLINDNIRFPNLRVIGAEGENLGVLSTSEALQKAREQGFDLVVISEKAVPPVAKILDYRKYLYEVSKKQAHSKAKSKKSKLKEFRFGPLIAEDAIDIRVKRAIEFLEEGNRVKFTVQLKGRQRAYPQQGVEKIKAVAEKMKEFAKTEEDIKIQGSNIYVTFVKH